MSSQAIEDAGLDVGIIYHSHTRTEPYPSQTDINLAFYPDSLYVIVGTAAEPEPLVRALHDPRPAGRGSAAEHRLKPEQGAGAPDARDGPGAADAEPKLWMKGGILPPNSHSFTSEERG